MITLTYESHGITTTVASRTRRTAILEAQYRKMISAEYPEITMYEIEEASVPKPAIPPDIDVDKLTGAALERYSTMLSEYNAKVQTVRVKNEPGYLLYNSAANTSYLLARIIEIKGASFTISDTKPVPTFVKQEVLKAFDSWIDTGALEDGWWKDHVSKINELDTPLTSPIEAPPDTLTEDEKRDPLSLVEGS